MQILSELRGRRLHVYAASPSADLIKIRRDAVIRLHYPKKRLKDATHDSQKLQVEKIYSLYIHCKSLFKFRVVYSLENAVRLNTAHCSRPSVDINYFRGTQQSFNIMRGATM